MITLTRVTLLFGPLIVYGCSAPAVKTGRAEGPRAEFVENPDETVRFAFRNDTLIKVEPNSNKGFNFAYYLFVPSKTKMEPRPFLLVEPNNTGSTSDDLAVHDQAARKVTERGYLYRISKRLGSPMLIPVFPRPATGWEAYIHYLNRRTIEIDAGPLKRVDLQLKAMIQDARARLSQSGVRVAPNILLNGFSASGGFALRFAALHPQFVQAVSAGGINALPTLPLKEWQNQKLPFPIGVGDLEIVTGEKFDVKAYLKIPQKIYMGELDTNDTVPFRDSWSEREAEIIRKTFGTKMMPERWIKIQSILKSTGAKVNLTTYPGVGHSVTPEIEEDIFQFFSAHRE